MNTTGQDSVLGPFFRYLADYKRLLAAMAAIAVTSAVASLVTNLGPPWPSRGGVASLTAITSMMLLAWTFTAWRRRERAFYIRLMQIGLLLSLILIVAYLFSWASFVKTVPGAKATEVGGYSVRPAIRQIMKQDNLMPDEIFVRAEYNPFAVWTNSSIVQARVLLVATWLGFFCNVSIVLTTLILSLEADKAHHGKDLGWGEAKDPSAPGRGLNSDGSP